MSTRKLLWWIVIVAWAVLLLALGVWSAFRSPSTVKEQRDIAAAQEVIDEVVGKVSGEVPADWHFLDEGYEHTACELTVVREGVQATRTLSLSGPPGSETEAITQIASVVPGARIRPGEGPAEGFYADAGGYVAVRGGITAPGMIVIQMKTGCRPPAD